MELAVNAGTLQPDVMNSSQARSRPASYQERVKFVPRLCTPVEPGWPEGTQARSAASPFSDP